MITIFDHLDPPWLAFHEVIKGFLNLIIRCSSPHSLLQLLFDLRLGIQFNYQKHNLGNQSDQSKTVQYQESVNPCTAEQRKTVQIRLVEVFGVLSDPLILDKDHQQKYVEQQNGSVLEHFSDQNELVLQRSEADCDQQHYWVYSYESNALSLGKVNHKDNRDEDEQLFQVSDKVVVLLHLSEECQFFAVNSVTVSELKLLVVVTLQSIESAVFDQGWVLFDFHV